MFIMLKYIAFPVTIVRSELHAHCTQLFVTKVIMGAHYIVVGRLAMAVGRRNLEFC
jgi:hypothetical protein